MDLNIYIKKSHIRAVEKFNEELKAWAKETGEKEPRLYEDLYTSFTLSDTRVENGYLKYNYDGKPDSDLMVVKDDEDGKYYEEEGGLDDIMGFVRFWRACLKRAKKYWSIDPDLFDKMQEADNYTVNEEDEVEEDDEKDD